MTDTLEIVDLEELILEDDTHCEFRHNESLECSIEVTHRMTATCMGESFNVCKNAAMQKLRRIDDGKTICSMCKRKAGVCWRIIPI